MKQIFNILVVVYFLLLQCFICPLLMGATIFSSRSFINIIDKNQLYNIYCIYTVYTVITRGKEQKMDIVISNSSEKPIYEQIVSQIKDAIIKGVLKEAETLPSIRSLARELKISVITTKRAYDELQKEGFIVIVPGKGTFVAAQNKDLLRESRIRIVEEKLIEAVSAAKSIELSFDELLEMLKLFYKEDY